MDSGPAKQTEDLWSYVEQNEEKPVPWKPRKRRVSRNRTWSTVSDTAEDSNLGVFLPHPSIFLLYSTSFVYGWI